MTSASKEPQSVGYHSTNRSNKEGKRAHACEELRKRGRDWKEDQMELRALGFEEEMCGVLFEHGDRQYEVGEVKALPAIGAMMTQEADSMSAMKFRMRKADKALSAPSGANTAPRRAYGVGGTHKNHRTVYFGSLRACRLSHDRCSMCGRRLWSTGTRLGSTVNTCSCVT